MVCLLHITARAKTDFMSLTRRRVWWHIRLRKWRPHEMRAEQIFYSSRMTRSLQRLPVIALMINGHEANNAALLYDCLRTSGFGVAQLSLETYFSFAAQGNRMQDRPDLVVFDGDFDGRFNLSTRVATPSSRTTSTSLPISKPSSR